MSQTSKSEKESFSGVKTCVTLLRCAMCPLTQVSLKGATGMADCDS